MNPRKKTKKKKHQTIQDLPETSYYVLHCYHQPGDATISELPVLPNPLDNWMGGDRIDFQSDEPLEYVIWPEDAGSMRPFYNLAIPLMNREMVRVLQDNGADNLQAFPTVIRNRLDGRDFHDYLAVNIIGKVSLVNPEESDYDDLGFGEARFFHRLTIREEDAEGRPIFRLKESVNAVFLHVRLKTALQEAGFERLDFVHPMRWAG